MHRNRLWKRSDNIARYLVCSAERGSLPYKRQDIYDFCIKLDSSEKMKAAAEKVLDEEWLPNHSKKYRELYCPAYRVLYTDFMKSLTEGE